MYISDSKYLNENYQAIFLQLLVQNLEISEKSTIEQMLYF